MSNTFDIVIPKGQNYQATVEYRKADNTGVDLTGYTFSLIIKDRPGGTVLSDVSSAATKDAVTAGRININIPHATTAGYTFDQGVYQLIATNSGETVKTRVVEGRVLVRQ